MAHVRKQVRDAFIAALTGISGVQKVGGARAHAYGSSEYPAIAVITTGGSYAPIGQGDEEHERSMFVDVIITDHGREDVDDALDAIAVEVERRILGATGSPWDDIPLHHPVEDELSIGEAAEQAVFHLRTRFVVRFTAEDVETIAAS